MTSSRATLLSYKKFVTDKKNYASPFIINPFDPCVANGTISGLQMTVTWHVHDLKFSHVHPFHVTKFCRYFASIYGNGLIVHQGKVHDYLGMDLNFALDGIVQVSMITYMSKVILDFPEKIASSCTLPAGNHLFTVRAALEAKFLPEEQAQVFHHTVAQLLFLCKQTCRDIQTAVYFLTTCMKRPNKDNWGKLKRVLRYLHGTHHMKLNLTAHNLNTIQWWVNALHATCKDCRGHMGAVVSLGKGATISFSNKLKINAKSSTKSELIGTNKALFSILHTRYFIEAQGYSIKQNILFRNILLAMYLEVNGLFSSSKCTKHIKWRYFFIHDKINNGNLKVIYCPTEIMWADILTKPKQGRPFHLNHSILMNISFNYDDEVERKLTHPLLLPKEEHNKMINDRLPKVPLLHPRSVLGTKPSSPHSRPTKPLSMTNLVR
jgi:hypothetical protein